VSNFKDKISIISPMTSDKNKTNVFISKNFKLEEAEISFSLFNVSIQKKYYLRLYIENDSGEIISEMYYNIDMPNLSFESVTIIPESRAASISFSVPLPEIKLEDSYQAFRISLELLKEPTTNSDDTLDKHSSYIYVKNEEL
jgi:hypothetical protein